LMPDGRKQAEWVAEGKPPPQVPDLWDDVAESG
jgi:hypothetical protein